MEKKVQSVYNKLRNPTQSSVSDNDPWRTKQGPVTVRILTVRTNHCQFSCSGCLCLNKGSGQQLGEKEGECQSFSDIKRKPKSGRAKSLIKPGSQG